MIFGLPNSIFTKYPAQSSSTVRPDVERKNGLILPKLAEKVAKPCFSFKVMFFKIPPKVVEYLRYFSKKNCLQNFLKIAQSGRTGRHHLIVSILLLWGSNPDWPQLKLPLKPAFRYKELANIKTFSTSDWLV